MSQSPTPEAAPIRVKVRDGGRLGAAMTAAVWMAVAALWTVTYGGRNVSAPPGWLAAAVTFLPYLYAAVLGAGFFVWTLLPDRRSLPFSLGALVLTGAALWGPSWANWPLDHGEGESVRVMTWNLRRLWGGPADGGDARACAIQAIEQASPDVLTLLEVSADDVDSLQQALAMTCVHHTYKSTLGTRNGGLATCVRSPTDVTSGGGLRFVDQEDWYYVATEVRHGSSVFNVLAAHLTPYDYAARRLRTGVLELATGSAETLAALERSGQQVVKGQSDQAAALLARVERFKHATVVAGDFNSTRDAALHTALRHTMLDAWEQAGQGFGGTIDFVSWVPLRIDYIYATDAFAVRHSEVLQVGCSDHRPVVADLVLRSVVEEL